MSQRKKYSKEFKIDAINLVKEQGYSCSEAAKSLGLAYDLLNRWIRESEKLDENQAFRGNGKLTAEQLEIRQLKEENRRLKMEKEILKKASAFFAQEMK
jgi:transposase